MDLIQNYGSDSDEADVEPVKHVAPVAHKKLALVKSAPLVIQDFKAVQRYINPHTSVLPYNPRAEEMWRPMEGPAHPNKATNLGAEQGVVQNSVTGFVQHTHIESHAFDEQHSTFESLGYAMDPTENRTGAMIGDSKAITDHKGLTQSYIPRKAMTKEQKALRKKRKEENGDVEDPETFKGPWATYYHEEAEVMPEPNEEQLAWAEQQVQKKKREKREEPEVREETSTFHGDELYDYQGRSYIVPPSHLKPPQDLKCFIPKKQIHTWAGHKKGVSAIRWFPGSAHLLLSSSMDSTVKLWEVHGKRRCLRTFEGHDEAVRDIAFNHDGTNFLSCSYDRYVKLWDTETGQCISRHTTKRIPLCVKFFPEAGEHEHEFLVGQSNKLVVQWDARANEVIQQYDEHLGPVNSITFVDNNRRFLSTSDDKKVFVWEYGIPVVVKHLAEPDMHSMPITIAHPNGKLWLGQSQDNQVLVYSSSGRFKLNTKKSFRGHLTAGYACGLDFSPDGKYVISGDAEGRVFFWDWRSARCYKKIKAHDKVCIGVLWHPWESSKVATCSWDGTIKYWD